MSKVISEHWIAHYHERFQKELSYATGDLQAIRDNLLAEPPVEYSSDRDLLREAIFKAYEDVRSQLNRVGYMQESSVKNLHSHNWYAGPAKDARVWNRLVQRLRSAGRTDEEIQDIDDQSTAVLSLTHTPGTSSFRSQGVVVGHVQSGKTGNIAAILAKASDTPYKFFLVLSGLTDALREQTQERLEQDLGTDDASVWHAWTSTDHDFAASKNTPFQFDPSLVQLAVLKKNKFVLERFLQKLKKTPVATLRNTPFLIIDDECDQASVNSARVSEEMTKLNELIRSILDVLPRVSYVGYTATPYANVLINPHTEEGELADLYPRDFIYALTPPAAYFGAERLFGREAIAGELGDDEEDSFDGLDMIRVIPDEELPVLRPSSRDIDLTETYTITRTLDRSLKYFLIALAARAVRGQADRHSSMLINTSHLVRVHFRIAKSVENWLTSIRQRIRMGESALIAELRALWWDEAGRVDAGRFNLDEVGFEELLPHLETELESLEVIVENGESVQRIDFGDTPRKYVVIGGNVVSRGLTLEGLIVSFFLRTANQYDTLMQMGRWFGYRQGYQDLPRIWMEENVRSSFRSLAMVEAEIRSEIRIYHRKQLTPLQFAVRVRQLPGLLITARNKMHHARRAQVSYANRHLQTFRFARSDLNWLQENWDAGGRLITALEGSHHRTSGGARNQVYSGVPVELIIRFLQEYNVHEKLHDMAAEPMLAYIQSRMRQGDSRYSRWNVAVMGPGKPEARLADLPLGPLGKVPTFVRSSLNETHDVADIKALMSVADLKVDMGDKAPTGNIGWAGIREHRSRHDMSPIILLYPIDRTSDPGDSDRRYPLNAAMDVLGLGIWFPDVADARDASYVSVDLPPIEHDEDDEYYAEMGEELTRGPDEEAESDD